MLAPRTHRISATSLIGTLGLDAGSVAAPGLYVANRVLYYAADDVRDRNGRLADVEDVNIDAFGNAIGVAGTIALPAIDTYLSASLGLPLAFVHVRGERPEANFDRFGLADIAIKPLQAGWRIGRADVLAAYTLYVPIRSLELDGHALSRGQVSHQFSTGGAYSFDPSRRWFATALFSYDVYQRKRGLDITRGDTLQILGGLGARPSQTWELGIAGSALWQVADDHGADIPPLLRGARGRAFALGPEVALTLAAIRTEFRLRYEFEFGVRSRPRGQIALLSVAFTAVQRETKRAP